MSLGLLQQNGTNGSLQSLLQKSGLEPDDKTARSSTPVIYLEGSSLIR